MLGLVGAGGIGMALDTALNLFQWDRVAMVLFSIFCVVRLRIAVALFEKLKVTMKMTKTDTAKPAAITRRRSRAESVAKEL